MSKQGRFESFLNAQTNKELDRFFFCLPQIIDDMTKLVVATKERRAGHERFNTVILPQLRDNYKALVQIRDTDKSGMTQHQRHQLRTEATDLIKFVVRHVSAYRSEPEAPRYDFRSEADTSYHGKASIAKRFFVADITEERKRQMQEIKNR